MAKNLFEEVADPLPRLRPDFENWILPGRAWGVTCGVKAIKDKEGKARPYVDVKWEEPVNKRYLNRYKELKYEVLVKLTKAPEYYLVYWSASW